MGDTWEAKAEVKVYGKDEPVPVVISLLAERQIRTLLDEFPEHEWMAGLVGERRDIGYYVSSLMIPEQEGSEAHIEVTPNGAAELNRVALIGWIHSHNTMAAFQSGTDVETSLNHEVSVTVNNDFDFAGTVNVKLPVGGVTLLPVIVSLEYVKVRDDEWLATVKDKIKIITPQVTVTSANGQSYFTSGSNTSQAYSSEYGCCPQCRGRLKKKHTIVECDSCGKDFHKSCFRFHERNCKGGLDAATEAFGGVPAEVCEVCGQYFRRGMFPCACGKYGDMDAYQGSMVE